MTDKDDGGPAFPSEQGHTPEGTWNPTYAQGMTLRDWFAGQTAAAITGGLVVAGAEGEKPAWVAEAAYALADAMIAERAK